MARIVGVDLPDNKKMLYALTSVFGVGMATSEKVLKQAKIDPDKRARDLTADEVNTIQRLLDKYLLEGNLRRVINDNIERLKRVKSYRGSRHSAGMPARGQRTRTNSRTARGGGRRKTVGAMTKEMAAKLDAAKAKK